MNKRICQCCGSNTGHKGQKARTDSMSVFRKPRLEKFYFVGDIDPSVMAGRIQVTAYHYTIGSGHGV